MADHLRVVPDLPDDEFYAAVPVCSICPPGSLGSWAERRDTDWEITCWHLEPCPRASEPKQTLWLAGCETCHNWHKSDVQGPNNVILTGWWLWWPKHGRTPLTSSGGADPCPQMEIENARIEGMAARSRGDTGPLS